MARPPPRKKKAAPRKQPPPKEEARTDVYALYQAAMKDISEIMAGRFSTSLRDIIEMHHEIAPRGYYAWRLAQHRSARAVAYRELEAMRYAEISVRTFAASMFDSLPVDDQYLMRLRAMTQSTLERLEYLLISGQWTLPDLPTLEMIRDKIKELGGNTLGEAVPNIHRNWKKQRTARRMEKIEEREKDEAYDRGISVEQYREEERKRRESQRADNIATRLRRLDAKMHELGVRTDSCKEDGWYVRRGGTMVKLQQRELLVIDVAMRHHNPKPESSEDGGANPST